MEIDNVTINPQSEYLFEMQGFHNVCVYIKTNKIRSMNSMFKNITKLT